MSDNAKATADSLERRLDDHIEKARRGQKLTLIVGVILILFIATYLTVLRGYVADLAKPESVVLIATQKATEMIPELAAQMTKEGVASAPSVVGSVMDTGLQQIPILRREAELQLTTYANKTLDDVERQINEVTEYAYKNDAADVRKFVHDLNDETGRREFTDYLYVMMAEPIQTPAVRSDIQAMEQTLRSVSDHMEHLIDGQGLTDEEQKEKNLLVGLRELSRRSQ